MKIDDYKIKIRLGKTCTMIESKGSLSTIGNIMDFEKFKYGELEEKLTKYFMKCDKILLGFDYKDLERRIKTLTKNFGHKVELIINTVNDQVCVVLMK